MSLDDYGILKIYFEDSFKYVLFCGSISDIW